MTTPASVSALSAVNVEASLPQEPWRDKFFVAVTSEYLQKNPDFVRHVVASDKALSRYVLNPEAKPEDRQIDPALLGEAIEELTDYPGVIAIAAHQKSHALYQQGHKAQARRIAEAAHRYTGIDLHPGATLGDNPAVSAKVFMDHGTGIVVGEQAFVGADTVFYHGSTLGAFGNAPEGKPRHPHIGSRCTISVGVQILGHVQAGDDVVFGPSSRVIGNRVVIGNNVKIGANAHINDNVTLEDGISVGSDTVIAKHTGRITREELSATNGQIPPYSLVSRDEQGVLQIESNFRGRLAAEGRGQGMARAA